jgi:imidazole glycerol-phosphate synthase subunit HisF
MLVKRIIPCLDVQSGKTIKGIRFENLREVGDPVSMAANYSENGADELVLLDISATNEKRDILLSLVKEISNVINIPFTVGGGLYKIKNVEDLLSAGADKVAINTSAFLNPKLIEELSIRFGTQSIVLAIDTKKEGFWKVFLNGGRVKTERNVLDWAKEAVRRGAGEILITSMKNDGTKEGFDLEITQKLSEKLPVPIISSGGAGKNKHFLEVFDLGKADAALAASVFHFKEIEILELKKYLKIHGIPVRI